MLYQNLPIYPSNELPESGYNYDDIDDLKTKKRLSRTWEDWLYRSLSVITILYMLLCYGIIKSAEITSECHVAGICTIDLVSENPYRVYYTTQLGDKKILFHPENDLNFKDNVVNLNRPFRFVEHWWWWKRVRLE